MAVVAAKTMTRVEQVTLFGVTMDAWHFWVIAFSFGAIVYTILGGMWSEALMDGVQFVFMMAGALIVLPIVMSKVGWWPGLTAKLPVDHLKLVTQTGDFNWVFTIAIPAPRHRVGRHGPGTPAAGVRRQEHQDRGQGDGASRDNNDPLRAPVDTSRSRRGGPHSGHREVRYGQTLMLSSLLPVGVMGFVICGFLASQISTIDSNLSAAATLCHQRRVADAPGRRPTTKEALRIVRWMTFISGVFMIIFSYWVRNREAAVNAYLTVISFVDMPLFVMVVFGLLWRRANITGALVGYFPAPPRAPWRELRHRHGLQRRHVPLRRRGRRGLRRGVLMRKPTDSARVDPVWKAKHISQEEIDTHDIYHIWPVSAGGKLALGVLALGMLGFSSGPCQADGIGSMRRSRRLSEWSSFSRGGLLRLAFD